MPHIIERGSSWFKSIGPAKSYGPKLFCVSGHVNKQVCVELPMGISCRQLIDDHAGGVWKGRKAKGAVPGGISMGLLSADELDLTPLVDFKEEACESRVAKSKEGVGHEAAVMRR